MLNATFWAIFKHCVIVYLLPNFFELQNIFFHSWKNSASCSLQRIEVASKCKLRRSRSTLDFTLHIRIQSLKWWRKRSRNDIDLRNKSTYAHFYFSPYTNMLETLWLKLSQKSLISSKASEASLAAQAKAASVRFFVKIEMRHFWWFSPTVARRPWGC